MQVKKKTFHMFRKFLFKYGQTPRWLRWDFYHLYITSQDKRIVLNIALMQLLQILFAHAFFTIARE